MPQVVYFKGKDDEGKDVEKKSYIIRSWSDSRGEQIYFHANGVYGYKVGSPIRDSKEFDIIGDPIQRQLAQEWWDRIGQEMSKRYYDKKKEELLERQRSQIPGEKEDVSQLDVRLYKRKGLKAKKFGEPETWIKWFSKRPEWWGYAGNIEINGYRYEMMEMAEGQPDGTEIESKTEAKASNF